jgi:hypothetical protein
MAWPRGRGGCRLSATDNAAGGTTAGDDAVEGAIGHSADGVAVGKGIRQTRQSARSDPQQSLRSGDNYFGEQGGNNQWLVAQILEHGQLIRDLALRLDNIPTEFRKLQGDVQKLKDVEITVRPSEIVLKPLPPPDAVILPMRTLLLFLLVFGSALTLLVAYLLWRVIYV